MNLTNSLDIGAITFCPKGAYSATTAYVRFDLVTGEDGSSYLAQKDVPVGTPLTDTTNWYKTIDLSDVNAKITEIQTAENARISAETARASAEEARISNETVRQSAETVRVANESARIAEFNATTGNVANALKGTMEPSGTAGTALRKDDVTELTHNLDITQYGICDVEGTPSTETPAVITGRVAGGKAYGKNLFDISKYINESDFDSNGFSNVVYPKGTYSINMYYQNEYNKLSFLRVYGVDKSTIIGMSTSIETAGYITASFTSETDWNLRIYYNGWASPSQASSVFLNSSNCQIELGTTVTDYEQYKTPISYTVTDENGQPVTLYGLPVESGGNITIGGQSYIADYIKAGLCHRKIKNRDLGTLSWSLTNGTATTSRQFKATLPDIKLPAVAAEKATMLCTNFDLQPTSVMYANTAPNNTIGESPTRALGLRVVCSEYNDLVSFQTAMSGVMLYYQLETETTEPVTVSTVPAIAPTTTWISDCPSQITYNRDLNAAFGEILTAIAALGNA